MSKILSIPNVLFWTLNVLINYEKNKLSQQLKFFNILNKNVTRTFLVYSDHSWGRRRFDVRRQSYQKFQEKIFPKKFFFALKNILKSFQHGKVKKNFFGQIGLQIFAPHRSAFFAIILRWA